MTWLVLLYVIGLLLARHVGTIHAATQDEQISKFFHGHTNNWVVLVSHALAAAHRLAIHVPDTSRSL